MKLVSSLLIFVGLLLAAPVQANQMMMKPPVAFTATTSSQQAIAANNLRSYIIIVNTGAQIAYVKFATAIQSPATQGIPIPPGGNYEPFIAPANPLWVSSASATTSLVIVEGQ